MNEFALVAGLVALLAVIILFFVILDRQAQKCNQVVSFLADRYETLSNAQNQAHQKQIESLLNMNLYQAERHQKQVDSLLGLIDELAARANPDKITSAQIKNIEQYLESQTKQIR